MKNGLTLKSIKSIKNIIIVILIVGFVYSFIRQEITMKRIQEELTTATQTLNDVNDKNIKLQSELEEAKTQNEYLEKLARERLGMVKPGESVVNFQKND